MENLESFADWQQFFLFFFVTNRSDCLGSCSFFYRFLKWIFGVEPEDVFKLVWVCRLSFLP